MGTAVKLRRERGGATHPCPVCDGVTRVRVTRRVTVGPRPGVRRMRVCVECGHTFHTLEQERKKP